MLSSFTSAIADDLNEVPPVAPPRNGSVAEPQPVQETQTFADELPPVAPRVIAPDLTPNRINELVSQELQANNVPGYAIAVIKNGAVIFKQGYGVANIETGQRVTPQTVFGLASMTKTFTAVALLSLVDRGLIGLDDPLEKYLNGLSRPYRQLRIRQLASMTAGVPSTVPREVVWQEQLPMLEEMPLVSEPGSQFLYSNFSYRLLGSVIQAVTNETYFNVVQSVILEPLHMNMTATTVALEGTGLVAQPYDDGKGTEPLHPVRYKNPEVSFSAGMLATNLDDMIRYVEALLQRQMLSPAAFKTLWYERPPLSTGQPDHWAFGWGARDDAAFGGRVCAMNGGLPGVASTVILLPDRNCAVIALSNLRKPQVYAIARKVARLVFAIGEPVEPPELPGGPEQAD